tara:strand:+ start:556 stop:1221 length:666 start_codon:yes stop_codon:yes gene_type:complete
LAFLGKIGKTLGLGSTGQVLGSVALAGATGNPAYVSGAFRSSQMGSAVESAQGSNVQNTIELQSSGSEGLGNNLVQARTGRGIISQIPTTVPEAIGLGIDYFFGGGNGDVCQPQGQKPFSVNKMNGCITVTRKQQARLKEMVSIVGLEMTADAVGLDPDQLVLLLLKRFKARGKGITAASMRTTKRTIRQIKSLHSEVSSMAGRKTPVRRTAAVKQVKYSN